MVIQTIALRSHSSYPCHATIERELASLAVGIYTLKTGMSGLAASAVNPICGVGLVLTRSAHNDNRDTSAPPTGKLNRGACATLPLR